MTNYPKTMVHPHFRKGTAAVVEGVDPNSGRKYKDYQGTADRLPPLFVENDQQEDRARAKGYLDHGEAPAAIAEGTEYPLMMVHPEHVDAVPDEKVPHSVDGGPVTFVTVPGKPERYPHRTVATAAEELAWRAKGYDRPGVCDPAAVEASIAMPYDPNRGDQEWPKYVQTGVDPAGKPIMTLMQDPAIKPEVKAYPMWITTGKDPNTGDVIGKAVDSLDEHIALCRKLGMPDPGGERPAPPPVPVPSVNFDIETTPISSEPTEIACSDAPAPLSHGDKIRLGRERKKAEREAEQAAVMQKTEAA